MLLQVVEFTGTLAPKQVTVIGGLLHSDGVDGVALLEQLLRGSPLLDQIGGPRGGVGLAEAVEDESGCDATDGYVEAALLYPIASVG